MFLTFGFSGRYLGFSLRYPLLVRLANLCRSSILSETRSYLILYITSTRVQFSRWNIICNVHGYHYNLRVAPGVQNVIEMLEGTKGGVNV